MKSQSCPFLEGFSLRVPGRNARNVVSPGLSSSLFSGENARCIEALRGGEVLTIWGRFRILACLLHLFSFPAHGPAPRVPEMGLLG